jgi:hypothetical protein
MQFDGLVCGDPLRGGRVRYRHGGAALNLGLQAMANGAAAGGLRRVFGRSADSVDRQMWRLRKIF